MKRVLLVTNTLQPPGGGSAVGAWALQALSSRHEVTVLTWVPVQLAGVNRAYGTFLDGTGVRFVTISAAVRCALAAMPFRLALLRMHLLIRRAKAMDPGRCFDVALGLNNEIDLGVRAIQYIHYPWNKFPRPDTDYRWYHLSTPLRAYRRLCTALSDFRPGLVTRNLTLANSDWTGAVFERYYGVAARTLHPPVPGGFPDVPFEARDQGFVCLGRIDPGKELDKLIRILTTVRTRGHDLRLHIVGHVYDRAYGRHLRRLVRSHADWISLHHDIPRDELVALVARNRYGIHGMLGEHFGIAPAELQRAGCITFVPDDGGQVEIVGGDERVIYHSEADAVEKIDRMLRDPGLRADTLRAVDARSELFSEERFMAELLEVVNRFEP